MKKILLIAAIIAILYLLVCVFVYLFQKHIVFNPQKGATPPPEDLNIKELWITTEDGQKLHSWWMPADSAKYTVLFFHGNAGNISRGEKRMRLFREMGCNALAVDYRGYGISSGKIEKEEDIYTDSRAAWDYLIRELGISDENIIIWGWSMGGAVAVDLAQHKKCHALVMESTFFSLYDMAGKFYRLLPMKWLMRLDFTSGEKLANIGVPVLFSHSKTDETVPYIHGVRLYEKFYGTKKFIEITGDHNHGIFDSQEKFLPEAKQFLNL
ncbi:MAG TPA: alpha/beta hydrolase [Bacteroidales bacterium]|nr:alpha/beta hydrolase [Bacteroidales bacterium]